MLFLRAVTQLVFVMFSEHGLHYVTSLYNHRRANLKSKIFCSIFFFYFYVDLAVLAVTGYLLLAVSIMKLLLLLLLELLPYKC
jgi:hypothetical protein